MPARHPDAEARTAKMAALYRDGMTLAAIGAEYGITRERVRQIISRVGVTAADRKKPPTRHERHLVVRERNVLRLWDLSLAEYTALVAQYGASSVPSSPFRRYQQQRKNAQIRGIAWGFTFRTWWELWQQSGKWELRGRGRGYCMARKGDVGPYATGNVYICTCADRAAEGGMSDGPIRMKGHGADASALCEALGLDPRVTRSVSFSMRVGEVVTVTHERYVSPAEARRLGAFFARFNLVPEEGTQDVTTVADTSRRLESA